MTGEETFYLGIVTIVVITALLVALAQLTSAQRSRRVSDREDS